MQDTGKKELLKHRISLNCDRWTFADYTDPVPTGGIRGVGGTIMDLRVPKLLESCIEKALCVIISIRLVIFTENIRNVCVGCRFPREKGTIITFAWRPTGTEVARMSLKPFTQEAVGKSYNYIC